MIDLKCLLKLNEFKDLDDTALVDIAESAVISDYDTNERLVAEKYAKLTLYLLEGTIDVQSQGGVHQDISANTQRSQNPIFYTDVPGHYGRCTSACKILLVKRTLMEKFGVNRNRDKDDLDYAEFDTLPAGDSSLSLLNEITALYKSKSITLPSIPETAIYINTALDNDDISIEKLAQKIQMDPVIAARVVQVANSALYGGGNKNDSIQDAIKKIGLEGVRTIVMGVVLRDLFMPNTEVVIKRMAQFYEHSIRIGVICYELAKRLPGLDPDHAFLAGILHDIGVVPILVVADGHTELAYKTSNLELVLSQLKSYIGGMVLQQWEFDQEYIDIAKHANDWKRNVAKGDYCDLVQVALMHSHLVGGPKIDGPELHKLPAFKRLGLDKGNPVENIQIVKELGSRVKDLVKLICRS